MRNFSSTARTAWLTAAILWLAGSAFGQFAATGTTTLSVTVVAEAALQVNTATTTLTTGSTTFAAPYTGTTSITFKIRTTKASGTGTITVANTNFQANGPTLAVTTFTCSSASGTACSGSQTASTSAVTVVSFAASANGAHSATAGDAASVAWSVTDNPQYQTGTYTSTATFTISAT